MTTDKLRALLASTGDPLLGGGVQP